MSDLTLVPEDEITCPRCGAGNPPDRYACLECGALLKAERLEERPGCLTAYALLLLIAGALSFMVGTIGVAWNPEQLLLGIATLIGGQLLGMALIAAAYGVWTLQPWARIAVMVLLALSILIALYFIAQVLLGNTAGGARRSMFVLIVNAYTLFWFAANGRLFRKP